MIALTLSMWPFPILMTSKFLSRLGTGGRFSVTVSSRETEGRGRSYREREVSRRISATLIDGYLAPSTPLSPLACKNTRSGMSTEINKRSLQIDSSPPLWFSRGLTVTFPPDKVSAKVKPLPRPFLSGKRLVGGGESECWNLFLKCIPPTTPPLEGPTGKLTKSQQRFDETTSVRLTFSEMHQGVKSWHILSLPLQHTHTHTHTVVR